jgi:hypothetical protein
VDENTRRTDVSPKWATNGKREINRPETIVAVAPIFWSSVHHKALRATKRAGK